LAQLSERAWEPPLWLEQLSERALLEPPLGQLSERAWEQPWQQAWVQESAPALAPAVVPTQTRLVPEWVRVLLCPSCRA